ncbi:PAS domain S-box protein [Pseudomonas oryzihabitans]|uniref:PAS domain S-box protein n=1 Tax=Pseudomonas oryzihabitans TaxID=47885 RepID=UPI003F95DE7C
MTISSDTSIQTVIALNAEIDRLRQELDAAEQYKADSAFLRSILASSADCIKVLDLEGHLAYMTDGGQALMEISDFNSVKGCPWPNFWEGEGHEDARRALQAAREGQMGRYQGEAKTFKGTAKWWDVQVTPIFDEAGQPRRILCVSRDITQAKLNELALAEQEANYRNLYNAIAIGFCVVEVRCNDQGAPADYRFLQVNKAFGEITGLADITGRWMGDLSADQESTWAERYAEMFATGKAVHFEHRARSLNDRHYDVYAYPLGPQAPNQVAVLLSDITTRKHRDAQRAALIELSARQHEFESAADIAYLAAEITGRTLGVSRVGYGIIQPGGQTLIIERDWTAPGIASGVGLHFLSSYGDALTGLSDGRIVAVDDVATDPRTQRQATTFAGVAVAAWVSVPLFDEGRLEAVLFVHSDRPRIWVMEELDFLSNVATLTQTTTARRRTKRQLRQFATGLERQVVERTRDRDRLWQLSSDLMLVADSNGQIVRSNPAWTEMLGWLPEELMDVTFFDLIHSDDLVRTEQAAVDLIEHRARLTRFENRYRCKVGGYRWISWTAQAADGFMVGVGRDITEDKEQAIALAAAEDALRQSQKMEAVGQLTGGLAHDFNNLLAAITGAMELIKLRLGQGRLKDLDRYIAAALGASNKAAALTHRLLAFSRRQTLEPRSTDVNALVADMTDMISRTVGPQIELVVVAEPELWKARIDPPQLENALLNLCINARDAMPGGGRITIQTTNHHFEDPASENLDLAPGDYLSLCVIDTGTGIPPELLTRIFDPFFTTKPIGEGTGLGLSMIYGFAKQSGGWIAVDSTPGEGTTMCLYVPRCDENDPASDVAVKSETSGRGEVVLVVEDEPVLRMLVTEILGDLGYTTLEAAGSTGGLEILNAHGRIDLLITDVGLPGRMNGRQLADAAMAVRPGLSVLFITGYADAAFQDSEQLGSDMEVLAKPFSMDAFTARVERLLGN